MVEKKEVRRAKTPKKAVVRVTNVDADDSRSFQKRMAQMIELVGGPTALAQKSGLSRAVIDKYKDGKSDPSRRRLIQLALATQVRLAWLVSGDGPMKYGFPEDGSLPQTVDEDLMGKIHDGISKVYKDTGARIAPVDQGKLAARILNKLTLVYDDPAQRPIGLALALEELKQALLQAPGDQQSSKRLA